MKSPSFNWQQELTQLAEKARNRTIDLADLKGGTFTITNYGAIGGIFGTPIINHPEVAILGVGKIKDTPVVRDGKIEIRKILSFPFPLTTGWWMVRRQRGFSIQ